MIIFIIPWVYIITKKYSNKLVKEKKKKITGTRLLHIVSHFSCIIDFTFFSDKEIFTCLLYNLISIHECVVIMFHVCKYGYNMSIGLSNRLLLISQSLIYIYTSDWVCVLPENETSFGLNSTFLVCVFFRNFSAQ